MRGSHRSLKRFAGQGDGINVFLIVSGMSGAGKSRAVATFEDLGYYCVDNLPIALIPRFAEICLAATERYERVALVTDVRAGGDFQRLFDSLDSMKPWAAIIASCFWIRIRRR